MNQSYAKASVTGVPKQELPASDEGFTISRSIYTPDGTEVDLSKVKQNDLMVVVLTGHATSGLDHQALITDLPEKEKPAAPAMPEY